jgi:hypothetical protein
VGRVLAPYPDTTKPFGHAHDLFSGPLIAVCGANIPGEVLQHLTAFTGARQITRRITGKRTATAWLDERLMLGGEWTDGEMRAWGQFYPGTVYWKNGADVHSMRIETFSTINVRVEQTRMSIYLPARAEGADGAAFRWLVHAPGVEAGAFSLTGWSLPGLRVRMECENIELSNPGNLGDLIGIECAVPVGKSGTMSMVFEII